MRTSSQENQTVSVNANDDGDVDWKTLVDLLREGKSAEIPCPNERDYERRATQIVKRADRKGIAVDVRRGEGVLRVEPRPVASGTEVPQIAREGTGSWEERKERQERREALRAERKAGRHPE